MWFLELATVEVSSDGSNFVRFDSVSYTPGPVGGYGTIDPANIYGLAGAQLNAYGPSFGTPFDLSWLKNKKEVVQGIVDIHSITHVRIVDISGTDKETDIDNDGTPEYYPCHDSFGNIIHDAYKTWGSGGADIEAVGVINTAE